jgi:hypothetical protein
MFFRSNYKIDVVSACADCVGTLAINVAAYNFNLRETSAHIVDRCVDRCTLSQSTRPNYLS